MSSIFVPFSKEQIAEYTIESKSIWGEFSRFVDDAGNPENLRGYMRALFPYIQERWQIYEYKRDTLVKKYIELLNLRRNILTDDPKKTKERAEKVVCIGQAIIQQSTVMKDKVLDQSRRYLDSVEYSTCYRSDTYGYYSFGKEGAPETGAMLPFLNLMVDLSENEEELLLKIAGAIEKMVRLDHLVYLKRK